MILNFRWDHENCSIGLMWQYWSDAPRYLPEVFKLVRTLFLYPSIYSLGFCPPKAVPLLKFLLAIAFCDEILVPIKHEDWNKAYKDCWKTVEWWSKAIVSGPPSHSTASSSSLTSIGGAISICNAFTDGSIGLPVDWLFSLFIVFPAFMRR